MSRMENVQFHTTNFCSVWLEQIDRFNSATKDAFAYTKLLLIPIQSNALCMYSIVG
jgi:hypothetical protein